MKKPRAANRLNFFKRLVAFFIYLIYQKGEIKMTLSTIIEILNLVATVIQIVIILKK